MDSGIETRTSTFERFRLAALCVWTAAIVAAIGLYISDPQRFSPEHIASYIREFERAAIVIYLAISTLRGLTLLPSTPLVLTGTILFPHKPWLVLATSLFGIVASSSMIYWLSDALGTSGYFEREKPHQAADIRARLEHPLGVLFVVLWAFVPLVPTDAVCYVAGSIKMNFTRFMAAIFLGELVLCSIYIFSGSYLMKSLGV